MTRQRDGILMFEAAVSIQKRGSVTTLMLNRPDKLNAVNRAMQEQLRAALAEIETDEACRAVLLTGAGRGFCAGQDLSERTFDGGDRPDLSVALKEFYNPLILSIRKLRKPVVAAVNGVAAGGGAGIALAADFVLAARSARFVFSFCRIGLIPDAGSSWILPRLVGDARGRALALLGEPVGAQQAAEWGMIWKVEDDDRLLPEAAALCERLSELPTAALGLTKQAFLMSATSNLDAHLETEAELQRTAGRTDDYRIGVTAFKTRQTPRFTGR